MNLHFLKLGSVVFNIYSMNLETIKKNIENLKKLKAVLKDKINKVDIQLQNEKTKLETNKLRHLKSKKSFFKRN